MIVASCLTDVPHPGEFIREELEARGWLQRDLAYILGMPEQAVNMIIAAKRGISPEMAKALGNAFDVSAEYFANLQQAYEMANARAPDPGIARRALFQNVYPVREMIKRGWLVDTDAELLEAQMMRFFAKIALLIFLTLRTLQGRRIIVRLRQLNWRGFFECVNLHRRCWSIPFLRKNFGGLLTNCQNIW